MILNIYKHGYDEHAELKVGDTVKLKKSRCGNWMCVEQLIIHLGAWSLGESDDDSD
jgi:hypothetical protein